MRLALIGPRGAGKTSVARLLAKKTGRPLASTDHALEQRRGRSIRHIVEREGWEAFRALETRALEAVLDQNPKELILDCGGGVILAKRNRELLAGLEHVILLHAAPEVLAKRLRGPSEERPPLTGEEDLLAEIRLVLKERMPLYKESANLVIDVSQQDAEEIVVWIMDTLRLP